MVIGACACGVGRGGTGRGGVEVTIVLQSTASAAAVAAGDAAGDAHHLAALGAELRAFCACLRCAAPPGSALAKLVIAVALQKGNC